MGRRRKKRIKWHGFGKIRLSRWAKIWALLLGGISLLLIASLISKNDILAYIALALLFTAPVILARYQFSKLTVKNTKHKVFIYAYIAVMWIVVLLPWARTRWLFAFAYFIACGIHLLCNIRAFKSAIDMDLDFILLTCTECIAAMFVISFSVSADISVIGWILIAVFATVITAIAAYFIFRNDAASMLKKIGYSVGVLLCAFALCWRIAVGLNYSLDFSKPLEYKTRITEKEYHSGKGRSTYYFTAYINGKIIKVKVGSDIYEKYDYSDSINVNIHKGALGMTYYTVDE